jgi:redox-sensitive bicupin YhaK (pirin superfamily)
MAAPENGFQRVPGMTHDLGGGFVVRRLLPFRGKRMIGPFAFFDHMGPAEFVPGPESDIRPHPHIGLSTLSYLYEGRLLHRDSLGNVQGVVPGEVNWMTAGRGIVHSERAFPEDYGKMARMEGLQFWVALPDADEDREPAFRHFSASDFPRATFGGIEAVVVAGRAFGKTSPFQLTSPGFLLDLRAESAGRVTFEPESSTHECGVYVAKGRARFEGESIEAGTLAALPARDACEIEADAGTRLAVFGGQPFHAPKLIWWNFVSSSKEKLEAAKKAWKEERFPLIPGEDKERIPLGD